MTEPTNFDSAVVEWKHRHSIQDSEHRVDFLGVLDVQKCRFGMEAFQG
jgi:hypothetical protein